MKAEHDKDTAQVAEAATNGNFPELIENDKKAVIEELIQKFNENNAFYIADTSTLTVEKVNKLRHICFKKGVELRVAKNTLIRKALERAEGNYEDLYDVLAGHSALMFSEKATVPANVIKDFRKEGNEKPLLKAAYIDSAIFKGDDQLDALIALKSKEQLLGEVIGLLQSPAQRVIGALQSGGQKIAGLLKTLEER